MGIYRFFLLLTGFIFSVEFVAAQEVVVPLQSNSQIDAYMQSAENAWGTSKKRSKHGEPHTIQLPFFDDFSKTHIYPSDTLWLNNNVYINNSFGVHPPSVGVATFDGLNSAGKPYRQGSIDQASRGTDTLTSTYIDLSALQDKDSVYLSFYYQAQGLGDSLERGDSLILQFHPDSLFIKGAWDDSAWVTVWSAPGSALQDFRQAMIAVRKKNFA